MTDMLWIGLMGFVLGGLGISLGGALMYWLQHIRNAAIHLIISISVGLTSCIILLEILPVSIESGGYLFTVIGIFISIILVFIISKIVHNVNTPTTVNHEHFYNSALLIAVAVAIHNFPVGIALGSTLTSSSEMTWSLSMVMVVHTIPEGIALGLPMILAGARLLQIMKYTIIVALPTGLGAMIGYFTGHIHDQILTLLIAIAAGTILLVSYKEILKPAIKEIGMRKGMEGILYGWMIGLVFLFVGAMHVSH